VAEQGYDLCAIEGIPYFYRQFGYEYALPLLEETKIRLEQIPDYESNLTFRPFTEKGIPRVMQLLEESQKKFYVHAIRDQQIWKMQHETGITGVDKFEGYVAEKGGSLIAYFRISSDLENKTLILREVSDADWYTNKAILKFLKDYGKQHGLDVLMTQTSYIDPLTQQLVSLGAIQCLPTYAWQIRIADYVKIFEKIKSLFEQRLASSIYYDLTEKLNFNFRRYTVQVIVENGLFTKIHRMEDCADRTLGLNLLVFVQLLLGYRSRQELEMIYPDFNIRQSHKHLIDMLFPKLPSHIHVAY
jgi:predicted acetyltransferase